MRAKVLICDDDQVLGRSLRELLRGRTYECECVASASEAVAALRESPRDLLVTDVNLGSQADGFSLLAEAKAIDAHLPVLMITGYASIPKAVAAIKSGAEDYVAKPIDDEAFLVMEERALERRRLRRENESLRQALGLHERKPQLIATDEQMAQVIRMITATADSRATVLITGESGTGKTMLARELHRRSSRRDMAFVEVNCGALPESLLESELFGHVKGAFTGALRDKVGKFEYAHGGTIFLDEISTASAALQVKLLRVLQDRVIERVGGLASTSVDVRVVLATNSDLEAAVRENRFREDLYYRINVVNVRLPALRERREDVGPLAQHFLARFAAENGQPPPRLTAEALHAILTYAWPGNVRELENAMQRAILMAQNGEIHARDLPGSMHASADTHLATASIGSL